MKRAVYAVAALVAVTEPAMAGAADYWERAREGYESLAEQARAVVSLGGVVVYRYRHTISGATLGCATGTFVGVSSTVLISPVTGGAALAGTGPAALVGCAAGGLAGGALGYQLDTTAPTLE